MISESVIFLWLDRTLTHTQQPHLANIRRNGADSASCLSAKHVSKIDGLLIIRSCRFTRDMNAKKNEFIVCGAHTTWLLRLNNIKAQKRRRKEEKKWRPKTAASRYLLKRDIIFGWAVVVRLVVVPLISVKLNRLYFAHSTACNFFHSYICTSRWSRAPLPKKEQFVFGFHWMTISTKYMFIYGKCLTIAIKKKARKNSL